MSFAMAQESLPPPRSRGAAPALSGVDRHKPDDRGGSVTKPHRPPADRGNYAAIDLGTNNCRLLIARPNGGDGFVVIDAFSRIVRLGEGLAATGRLSDAAIDRALSALSVCASKLRRRNVTLARSVATEACRRASNGADFAARVYAETGIKLDIISPQEEARLAVLGSHTLLEKGDGPALLFDIGGGSTEMVLLDTSGDMPRIIDWHSAPWGVVSLYESMAAALETSDDSARATTYAAMKARVNDAIGSFVRRLPTGGNLRLLGTSGTVTTLASVYLDLQRYDRRAVDGLILPSATLRDIAADLARKDIAARARIPSIGTERADLVVAGCAILEAILDAWPAERLAIADRGIREGILRTLMDAAPAAASQSKSRVAR